MDLQVDAGDLRRVGSDLKAALVVAHEVKDHKDVVKALADQAGHPLVVEGADHFLDTWSYGVGCLISDAERIADLLASTSAAYIDNEQTMSRGFRGH